MWAFFNSTPPFETITITVSKLLLNNQRDPAIHTLFRDSANPNKLSIANNTYAFYGGHTTSTRGNAV